MTLVRLVARGVVEKIECGEVLQSVAERERGDKQRGWVGRAERAEGGAFDQECEHHGDENRDHDPQRESNTRADDQRVRAGSDQLAMGEVGERHDAEDQGDAEREHGVQAAEADRVDGVFEEGAHAGIPK